MLFIHAYGKHVECLIFLLTKYTHRQNTFSEQLYCCRGCSCSSCEVTGLIVHLWKLQTVQKEKNSIRKLTFNTAVFLHLANTFKLGVSLTFAVFCMWCHFLWRKHYTTTDTTCPQVLATKQQAKLQFYKVYVSCFISKWVRSLKVKGCM